MNNRQLVINAFSPDIDSAVDVRVEAIRKPKEHEVLIKNLYVGINALYDRELYRGAVPYIDVQFPFVFGVEATGVVTDIGSKVSQFRIGDSVGTVKVGTAYQEFQIVSEEEVIKFPKATAEYLAMSPTGVSGFLAIEEIATLKPGETVVISAAAGGLGHIMVQLCKKKACHVIAICGTPEKVQLLENLHCCDRIINHRAESVAEVLDQEYANKIDVAFDSVGQQMFDAFLKNLAPMGRLVVIGLASELSLPEFQKVHRPRVYESIYWKGASVRCFMNHLYKDQHGYARKILFEQYQRGELQIKVDATSFEGIESIIDASKYLLAGKSCGKVVVKL